MRLQEMLQAKKAGITYTELILVVAMIALISPVVLPFSINFIRKMNLYSTRDKITSTLRKAQLYAMDDNDNQIWGVCLHNSNIRFYSGTCNSPVKKEDYTVPSSVEITGLTDFTFSKYLGEPNSTINIQLSSGINQINVSVNEVGGLNVN